MALRWGLSMHWGTHTLFGRSDPAPAIAGFPLAAAQPIEWPAHGPDLCPFEEAVMVNTTAEQRGALLKALQSPKRVLQEKVWTYLVATILDAADDQTPYVKLLCGDGATFSGRHLV